MKSLQIRKIRKKNPKCQGKLKHINVYRCTIVLRFFASCKAVCKVISLKFYNDNSFSLCTWCNINPPLFFFLKKEQVIRRRGKSQGTIGLIVLLNRSIITIRPRLPTGTKYSWGVSRKETQRKEPQRDWNQTFYLAIDGI